MSFGEYWCLFAPRHRWRFVKWLTFLIDFSQCKHCGRQWTTNEDARVTLPYHMTASVWERP